MSLKKNPEKLYDQRTLEQLLANGTLKQSEYDKHLKSLPDEEGNYDFINIEEEAEQEFDDEYDDEDEEDDSSEA